MPRFTSQYQSTRCRLGGWKFPQQRVTNDLRGVAENGMLMGFIAILMGI